MALWGNNDNIGTGGTVLISSFTKDETKGGYPVLGVGATFGSTDAAQVGDIIRIGAGVGGTFFGDAVIVALTEKSGASPGFSTCWIASTAGLAPAVPVAGTAGTVFTVSQLPKYTIDQGRWSEDSNVSGDADKFIYGVDATLVGVTTATQYETGVGWVGVTTYNQADGTLRVKKEILVAMSGITTGNVPVYDADPTA